MIRKREYDIDEILAHPLNDVEESKLPHGTLYKMKQNGETDPFVFYIHCLVKLHPDSDISRYIEIETQAQHLDEDDLRRQLSDISLQGNFIDALQINETTDEKMLLCETTEEIMLFVTKS